MKVPKLVRNICILFGTILFDKSIDVLYTYWYKGGLCHACFIRETFFKNARKGH